MTREPVHTAPPPLNPALIFGAFAFAYFLSALVRAVTATLAPVLGGEFGLSAADLGLLAGAYFLGFAPTQLPLGAALDRYGPRRVLLALMAVAVCGCAAFALARSLTELVAARFLIGVGVSACLMAPLTCYRRVFSASAQQRANAWMLMTGSFGMLASTLPVQWLLPVMGWRALFGGVAALLVLAALGIARGAPADPPAPAGPASPGVAGAMGGYAEVFRHPTFVRMAPVAVFAYGGLVAMQTLWIGPWLTTVAGQSPAQASEGLFVVNLAMLVTFAAWGAAAPRLARAGWDGERLIAWGWPVSIALLGLILALGDAALAWHWALWCVSISIVAFSQPALAQAFAPELAGRALSAFNLLIFGGIFAVQWSIGLAVDALVAQGASRAVALRLAVAGLGVAIAASFAVLVVARRRLLRPTMAR